MAGDWIKVQQSTPDKPEVFRLAAELKIAPEHVVGCLVRLWVWADQQSIDGNALSVTNVTLDRIACNAGFAQALTNVGWLVVNSDGTCTLPNFERHNGDSAKKRATTQKRVKNHRDKNLATEEKSVTHEALQGNKKSLPEKRREEKKLNTLSCKPDVEQVISHLNEKTGSHFRNVPSTSKLIAARIAEFSIEDCIAVIDAKAHQWLNDPKMSDYLRPQTLFSATNFANYAGQIGKSSNDSSAYGFMGEVA